MSNITVADLSAKHIGKRVIVHDGDENTYVGIIQDLCFETETWMRGVVVTGVEIEFPQARITFPLTAEVEIRS